MKECGNAPVNGCVVRFMHRYGALNFKCFQELGIHPGQLPVMGAIYHNEGLSLRELAEQIHIKPPTVTVTIQRLEKCGMVYKKPDEKDQRINRIYLTEKGKATEEQIGKIVQNTEETLIKGFSESEKIQFIELLTKATENLMQACGENLDNPFE